MAFRKRPQSPEPTKPLEGDLFAGFVTQEDGAQEPKTIPVPTGLSEEEDAQRFMRIQFGSMLCPNCETYYETPDTHFCPRCFWALGNIHTKPLKKKHRP